MVARRCRSSTVSEVEVIQRSPTRITGRFTGWCIVDAFTDTGLIAVRIGPLTVVGTQRRKGQRRECVVVDDLIQNHGFTVEGNEVPARLRSDLKDLIDESGLGSRYQFEAATAVGFPRNFEWPRNRNSPLDGLDSEGPSNRFVGGSSCDDLEARERLFDVDGQSLAQPLTQSANVDPMLCDGSHGRPQLVCGRRRRLRGLRTRCSRGGGLLGTSTRFTLDRRRTQQLLAALLKGA